MKFDTKYLAGLDVLRFLMAICILIVHFAHFSFPYQDLGTVDKSSLPFATLLYLPYRFGGFAVEIFWMISGIIFFHFYSEAVADKKMSFYRFICLRISRLYPLHLITLCTVAILQFCYIKKFGQSFVYTNNDVLHFLLNLLMINFWNPKFGLSFNGPFWSVSAEMFVYMIFFIFARLTLMASKLQTLLLVGAFFVFYGLGIMSPFYECLLYFFAGIMAAQWIELCKYKNLLFLMLGIIALLGLKYYTFFEIHNEYITRIINCFIKLNISIAIVIFFSKIFSQVEGNSVRILRKLGNMTYALYMIHISIQILLILLFYTNGQKFFNNSLFFCAYITITSIVGYICFRYLEMPAQHFLRSKLIFQKNKFTCY